MQDKIFYSALQTYYSVLDQFLKDNNLSLTQDELKKFISVFHGREVQEKGTPGCGRSKLQ